VSWDSQCVGEAENLCGDLFTGPITTSVPTMNEWGMIAFAGILGLIGFFYTYKRRKSTAR